MDACLCGVVRGEVPGLSEVAGDSCFLASLALPSGDSTESCPQAQVPSSDSGAEEFCNKWAGLEAVWPCLRRSGTHTLWPSGLYSLD